MPAAGNGGRHTSIGMSPVDEADVYERVFTPRP